MYVFSSQLRLTKLHITCEGTIEDDGYGMLQVRSRVGENATDRCHFSFQYSVLFSGGALASHSVFSFLCTSLCLKSITDPRHSGHFQPECLLLLKRPLREPLTLPGPGSRPLSLFCSLCRPCSLYADKLARSAFHLLFASSGCKLTVDVHT